MCSRAAKSGQPCPRAAVVDSWPERQEEVEMKNIILCSDGTGNSAIKGRGTNVFKLYEALDRTGSPGYTAQLAFYDDGVGTRGFRLFRILGGAFGLGLARNVRGLYLNLVRTYEAGDRIYLFGFSSWRIHGPGARRDDLRLRYREPEPQRRDTAYRARVETRGHSGAQGVSLGVSYRPQSDSRRTQGKAGTPQRGQSRSDPDDRCMGHG